MPLAACCSGGRAGGRHRRPPRRGRRTSAAPRAPRRSAPPPLRGLSWACATASPLTTVTSSIATTKVRRRKGTLQARNVAASVDGQQLRRPRTRAWRACLACRPACNTGASPSALRPAAREIGQRGQSRCLGRPPPGARCTRIRGGGDSPHGSTARLLRARPGGPGAGRAGTSPGPARCPRGAGRCSRARAAVRA